MVGGVWRVLGLAVLECYVRGQAIWCDFKQRCARHVAGEYASELLEAAWAMTGVDATEDVPR